MYAVVSLLDEQHERCIGDLWRELESECGLAGIMLTPLPHFTLHIAAEYDFKPLETGLAEFAIRSQPFTVQTTGLGIFSGASPVIFIPVIKTAALANFHRQIWELAQPMAVGPSAHYGPESWVPHITLAYGDVDPEKMGCAMEKLAFQTFSWTIHIDHLAVVYQLGGQVGRLQNKFMFGGDAG
jgi:2'-5' RNA ligase